MLKKGCYFPCGALAVFAICNTAKVVYLDARIVPLDLKFHVIALSAAYTFLMVVACFSAAIASGRRIVFVILFVIQALYLYVTTAYYSVFKSYLTYQIAVSLFDEALGLVRGRAVPLGGVTPLLVWIDLPAAVLVLTAPRWKAMKDHRKPFIAIMIGGFGAIAAFLGVAHIVGRAPWQLVSEPFLGDLAVVKLYGPLTNGLNILPDHSERSRRLITPERTLKGQTSSSHPNILVVQIESLDATAIDAEVDGRPVMPFMRRLASENIYYPYCLSYHVGGGTSDAEFSVLNSVVPLVDYPALKVSEYRYPNAVSTRLHEKGYSTQAFHNNRATYYNRGNAFAQMSFDVFFDQDRMRIPVSRWGISDGDMLRFARGWLSGRKEPWFAYVITMSSHGPFNFFPAEDVGADFKSVSNDSVRGYYRSLTYVDHALEQLLADESIRNHSYIFIFGDHAPPIPAGDYVSAVLNRGRPPRTFVPLVILTPDRHHFRGDQRVASFLDLAPTIFKASGIGGDYNSDGDDLLEPAELPDVIPWPGGALNRKVLFREIDSQIKRREGGHVLGLQ